MEFRKQDEKLNFIEQQFADEPRVNIITKERFEERVTKVFNILWERLSKSFGPGGAGTFISVYPNYYNTKDGFNIMKNAAFDTKLDQVICDMAMGICTRLNFTVGDGTTTAVIATKAMYDAYQNNKASLERMHILPRDIMRELENMKHKLLEEIDKRSISIRTDNPEELRDNIAKVVSISSNGNEEITNIIADLYKELMYPAITCTLANDGVTKSTVISGYKLDITLTDKIYINNDNNTMNIGGSDYIVFDHKVTQDTYINLLKPLSEVSSSYGRHLVCIAPYYDETALAGVIKTDLNKLYTQNKDIPLVLTVCSKVTGFAKTCINDLAMFLNTSLITSPIEKDLIEKYEESHNIFGVFNIDNRSIPGINVGVMKVSGIGPSDTRPVIVPKPYSSNIDESDIYNASFSDTFRVGYCDCASLGLKESSFSGFYYDEDLYKKYVSTAKEELDEVRRKCENIGTFSPQLSEKQKRYYALGLKTGIIEVGSTSEISQGYLKDTFDDAVKAAESAYNNGIVLGCNVTMSQILQDMKNDNNTEIQSVLVGMLSDAFKSVYKTVLGNVLSDTRIDDVVKFKTAMHNEGYKDFISDDLYGVTGDEGLTNIPGSIIDIIIEASYRSGKVFNLSTGKFDDTVINSAETDKEILKATIDLLSLLITGNQLVLR